MHQIPWSTINETSSLDPSSRKALMHDADKQDSASPGREGMDLRFYQIFHPNEFSNSLPNSPFKY